MAEEYDLKTDELIGKQRVLRFTRQYVAVGILNINGISLCVYCLIKRFELFSPKVAT